MSACHPNPQRPSKLRPLALCLAVALSADVCAAPNGTASWDVSVPRATLHETSPMFRASAAVPNQPHTTLLVKNCNDDGPDSLREAVSAAGEDATIEFDLAAMGCSTITLTTGQIEVTADNLTLHGPGADLLTIDGGYSAGHTNRIIHHSGTGHLAIEGLTLPDAKYFANAGQNPNGGCIYSNGPVALSAAIVSDCRLVATGVQSGGGGIWARGVTLLDSTVSGCAVLSDSAGADGGGIFVEAGSFTAKYSTIENNIAHSYSSSASGIGGGVVAAAAPTQIEFSTISGNEAEFGGGLVAFSTGATARIANSTFSGNRAKGYGAMEISDHAYLYNVTVAFNRASDYGRVGGISADTLAANGSIIAYNVYDGGAGPVEADLESGDGMVTGARNLIIAASSTSVPADTSTACPRLAPLLDNGGTTRTHALLPGSPAIDAGNNGLSLVSDQRGAGFDRIAGPSADIGAYEWKASSGDVINASGFEDCMTPVP